MWSLHFADTETETQTRWCAQESIAGKWQIPCYLHKPVLLSWYLLMKSLISWWSWRRVSLPPPGACGDNTSFVCPTAGGHLPFVPWTLPGTVYTGEYKLVQKANGQFLAKLKMHLCFGPSILLLGIYPMVSSSISGMARGQGYSGQHRLWYQILEQLEYLAIEHWLS